MKTSGPIDQHRSFTGVSADLRPGNGPQGTGGTLRTLHLSSTATGELKGFLTEFRNSPSLQRFREDRGTAGKELRQSIARDFGHNTVERLFASVSSPGGGPGVDPQGLRNPSLLD